MSRTSVFAMWLIKVRRQPTTALVIACASFIVIIAYLTLIECKSICSPKSEVNEDFYRSHSKWSINEMSTLGVPREVVLQRTDRKTPKKYHKETSKPWHSGISRGLSRAPETSKSVFGDSSRNTTKRVTPYNLTTPASATRPEYDILRNISFDGLMSVIEDYDLNFTHFLNWTKQYMLSDRKQSFEMPKWVVKSDDVCDIDTEMIVIIPSKANRVVEREIIRQTWASSVYGMLSEKIKPNSLRTKLVFTFGTYGLKDYEKVSLEREAVRYNDVVAADFLDSYRNLSFKMMIGLSWVNDFCRSAKYVGKVDLDTFVNLPLLSRFLLELSKRAPRYILGHKHTWLQPPVLRSGKWEVSKEDYPFDHYPPYILGHSYIITADLVHSLVSLGKKIPLLPTEDALITGVLARVIRAPRIHYEGFACTYKKAIPCRLVYNYDISLTKMMLHRYILLWRDLRNNECSEIVPPLKLDYVIRWDAGNMTLQNDRRDKSKKLAFQRMNEGDTKPWEYFWKR